MKLLIAIALPFLILSCALTPTEVKDAPKPEPETPAQPELPVEEPDDGLSFADPVTTGELLTDEDKKTVAGPVSVKVPEPTEDSAIDIKPSIPPAPSED